MAEFILSAFADEISPMFSEQLDALDMLGINMLELRGVDGKSFTQLDDREVKRVRDMLIARGIKLSALGSPLGKIKCDGDMAAHMALAQRVMDISEELDCSRIRMFSFYPADGMTDGEFKKCAFECVEMLLTLAEKRGFTLCHENEKDIYGETPERELELMEHFGGRLRAVLDPGNFAYCGVDGRHAPELLRDYITYCHIKDCDEPGCIVPPGEGRADIKGVLSALDRQFDGEMILTIEPHLTDFVGLGSLASDSIKHKFSFETPFKAFEYAANAVKKIIAEL